MTGAVYRKQEQEPASDAVTEVAPGVLRLMLPVDMPGLGHVNCYAIEDELGFALVDPGLPGDHAWLALQRRLSSAGIPLRRVHTVVVTHSHVDHFGASNRLQQETGADLVTHDLFESNPAFGTEDIDMDLLELDEDELIQIWERHWDAMGANEWGTPRRPVPPEVMRSVIAGDPTRIRFNAPEPTVRVSDREPVKLGGREWFALHTPGHTTDHLCLWDPTAGTLLSGDHVLPSITPHIAGSTALADPLASFVDSLVSVSRLDGVSRVLPAHGHPFDDLAGRVHSITAHHEERLDVLRAAGPDLPDAPVEAFMKVLFSERAWGDMAASETFAHLEHLRLAGRADCRRDHEGLLRYTIR